MIITQDIHVKAAHWRWLSTILMVVFAIELLPPQGTVRQVRVVESSRLHQRYRHVWSTVRTRVPITSSSKVVYARYLGEFRVTALCPRICRVGRYAPQCHPSP